MSSSATSTGISRSKSVSHSGQRINRFRLRTCQDWLITTLGENLVMHFAVNVSESEVATRVPISQTFMIQPEKM